MDTWAAICLAFPPEVPPKDDEAYNRVIKDWLAKLIKQLQDPRNPLVAHGLELLNVVDPAVNSLSFLTILHTLLIPGVAGPRERVLERLVVFLATFDARQIRYGGSHMLEVLNLVGSGELLPPSVAVDVLATAILRLDPTGSLLTTSHISLAKLAYNTNNIEPALPVIDKSIVFYPGMAKDNKHLYSDMSLPPPAYLSKENGLTNVVKSANVLEYDLLCGMMYTSMRDWTKAHAAFERVSAYPTRDNGMSKIMEVAYKKWTLVGLLLHGKQGTLPSYVTSHTNKQYQTLAKTYRDLAALFQANDAKALKAEAEKHTAVWQEDQNIGLVGEVLAAHQKWQVINLQHIYSKISIQEIRQRTRSAETGEPLGRDEDIEMLIQNTIIAGMLNAVIEKNDNGTSFLSFLPPKQAAPPEEDFAKELAQAALRLKALQPVFRTTHERLGTSREYIRHLLKEQRHGNNKSDLDPTLGGFDSQVDDEDLMGGVTSTMM